MVLQICLMIFTLISDVHGHLARQSENLFIPTFQTNLGKTFLNSVGIEYIILTINHDTWSGEDCQQLACRPIKLPYVIFHIIIQFIEHVVKLKLNN